MKLLFHRLSCYAGLSQGLVGVKIFLFTRNLFLPKPLFPLEIGCRQLFTLNGG